MISPAAVYVEPPLPTLEAIAALQPLPEVEGRLITDVLDELNAAIVAAGIEFEEGTFGKMSLADVMRFSDYRWISCYPVRGSNEGYYVHIALIPPRYDIHGTKLIAVCKVWRPAAAMALAAAAARLLGS